jgi:glycosyltransferase involved in cell wall biosynthesis
VTDVHPLAAPSCEVSVVVPLFNEAESLPVLHERIAQALADVRFEVVYVDDGSTDGSLDRLRELAARDERVRVISFRRNYGKSAALAIGFQRARGTVVATCDADLQDDPAEIPAMIRELGEGADLVSGWKRDRHDPATKTIPSRFFNFVMRVSSGVPLHDMNCGLKVYRREVVSELPVYGELHRFLPVLAAWRGFRVKERVVKHDKRRFGKSKFGAARLINGLLDFLSVKFLTGAHESPLHVFGRVALVLLAVGFAICGWMFVQWMIEGTLRLRPLLVLGMVIIVLGIQFVSIGLLGEMLAFHHRRADYAIKYESR